MKIVIAGGSGHLGGILAQRFMTDGHDVVVLSRYAAPRPWRLVVWDGETLGAWAYELDGCDIAINLAGRSVNCRYTPENQRQIMDSRLNSTKAIGQAIAHAKRPPRIWLQMSTATIYSHRYDAPNDEASGIIGGDEPDTPAKWRFSITVATAWEHAAIAARTPRTRQVILRTAMVMSAEPGGVFEVLLRLVRFRLGGRAGDGRQFVSWIHEDDFFNAIRWLIQNEAFEGIVNLCAPNPLPNHAFMADLRQASGVRLGLPAARLMLPIGAWMMRTETELILKSRRVVPGRLLQEGFDFRFPHWLAAAQDLCGRRRQKQSEPER
ncbi:MAG TPA: TIGR01777 family oxidoreductase [Tepidisphaeraceae bacterium]|nr:TIGR01777 family oxidoreductase [Tepidisphaeraceae bacterium]